MINLNEVVEGITLTKVISVSPDEDSKKAGIKKQVTIKMRYDGLTLNDIFQKALKEDIIQWQNGSSGRKNFDNIKDKQTIEVSAKSPGGAPQISPEDAFLIEAKAAGINVDDEKALTAFIIKKMKAAKA